MSFKCKECGGVLKKVEGEDDIYGCLYCGIKQKIDTSSKKSKKEKSNIEININNNINNFNNVKYGELDDGRRKTFGIYESALATLLFIIFNFVFLTLYGLLPINIRAIEAVYYIASFFIEFLFGVTAYTVAMTRKIRIQEAAGMNKKINGQMFGYAFLIAIICLFGFSRLTSVFIEFLELCGYHSVLSGMEISTFWQYLIYVVITCITPAICEELLFRGVIESGFKKYGKKVAIVVSALIFMLMHGNAEQTVHQFIIGLVIGYIFIETGNLWLGVIIHFFNNFISVTELYIFTKIANSLPNMGDIEGAVSEGVVVSTINPWLSLLINLVIALVVAFIAYKLLMWVIKKLKEENEKVNAPKVVEETNSTILIDGQEQDVSITIDGEKFESLNENGEPKLVQSENSKDGKPQLSVATIVMFALAGAYLLFDWITALLTGLGVI